MHKGPSALEFVGTYGGFSLFVDLEAFGSEPSKNRASLPTGAVSDNEPKSEVHHDSSTTEKAA